MHSVRCCWWWWWLSMCIVALTERNKSRQQKLSISYGCVTVTVSKLQDCETVFHSLTAVMEVEHQIAALSRTGLWHATVQIGRARTETGDRLCT